MLTTIPHLAKPQQEQLAQLILSIVKSVEPEKIICYGSRVTIMQDWGCFLDQVGYKETIHPTFDLLIITKENEKRIDHEIVQIAEHQCRPPATVTCIVHKLHSVNEALEAGSYFFSVLFHKGILVYDAGGLPLLAPHESFTGFLMKSKAEAYWDRWYNLAQRFLSLAVYSVSWKWPDQAIFLLHQAVEHACIALIRVYTGYRPNTHNLSRLLAQTENFSLLPMSVFPRLTKEETELFKLLLNGYSDSRYLPTYSISLETATVLVDRVKELHVIAESLYKNRIGFYVENEGISFPLVAIDAK